MVIFESSFLASESAADRPLTHARIGYQTWTRDLTAASVEASSEDEEGPADAPLRPDTAEAWVPTALPATWVVDLGTSRDIDYVGIAGHTLGSAGCAIEVETSTGELAGSPSEQVWTTLGSEIAPGNDAPLLFLDDSIIARFLRITITGGSTMPRIGVVYAGEIMAMPRPLYGGQSPMNLSRDTVLTRNLSRGGQFLGQSLERHGQVGTAGPWRYLEPDWYRETFDTFVKQARQYPFFYAWRPEDYPLEVAYCWATADIVPRNMGVRQFMEVSFPIQGIGWD